jgi:hypothetical protein
MLQGFGQLLSAGVVETCETYSGCAWIGLGRPKSPGSTVSGAHAGGARFTVPLLMQVDVSMLSVAL